MPTSFKGQLSQFGVVPKINHLVLLKKYQDLKQEAAAQEDTIKHLRVMLDEKETDEGGAAKTSRQLVDTQNEQFQELMCSFAEFFEIAPCH